SYWGNVNPVGPRGVYDEAKRFAEAMTMAYHRFHGVETRIVRIFNTYGPRMRLNDGRVVPALCGQALRGERLTVHGDGKQTRSFMYIDDCVKGINMITDSEDVLEPINLGSDELTTINGLVDMVSEIAGIKVSKHHKLDAPKGVNGRNSDNNLIKKYLGWAPAIPLRVGMEKTYEWIHEQMTADVDSTVFTS
ncbi:MAG: GDP-mannose 4,6-dehydratase, partial [Phycisphaerales bacterium]|nr:GDP-mannose 4,6-dehydratase [Phycisphaerales bacterium]